MSSFRRPLAALACLAGLAAAFAGVARAQDETAGAPASGQEDSVSIKPRVKLKTTLGDIVLELDGDKAPISTLNFVRYATEDFYDGTIFHRVIDNFMIQGGGYSPELDKKTKGLHDPIKNEWKNGLKNKRGTIAMARTQVHDSATSEFFINVVDNASLDRPNDGAAYAVFGQVVEGMDVVDKIRKAKLIAHPKYPGGEVTPEVAVVIQDATLEGGASYEDLKAKLQGAPMRNAIAQVEKETGGAKAQTTASGLSYIVMKEGTGAQPKPTDNVEVHYTGWLLDGTKFDSSVDRGEPATFPLNRVIPGWTEGVGLMKVGGKNKLIIPPDLGYGSRGAPPRIPGNSILVFEVELLSIK